MSRGWLASSELECPPHLGQQGRGADYARPERGVDRGSLRKGSLAHADVLMGTSQQQSSTPRKGDALNVAAPRDMVSPRPVFVRTSSNYGGNGPPVVASHHATRALSRPPQQQAAAFGSLVSPRAYPSGSYRDAALAAAQHGLSAYAHSASAMAAASAATSRALTPRAVGSAAAGSSTAASPGRPPPAPRPTQHSAPSPTSCPPNGTEFLPSCRAASPSRGSVPSTRSTFLPSRGSVPPAPGSPGRGGCDAAAAAAATAAASHRSGDMAMVTVTYNDLWWRGAFDGTIEPDDPMAGGGGTSRPLSGSTAGAIRVMSPGWGAAPPSAYEVDGRPGTRGGGPLYDMDGRPTTRGGQRPPSRAQLGQLSQQRLPAHVAPLGGPGWAGMFAGGCGTVSGEATAASAPLGTQYTPPRAPSAGGSISWSGDAVEPAGSHRRQLVPLPPAAVPAGVAARLGSPSSRGAANAGGAGGVLASLPPTPSVGLSAGNQNLLQQGLPASGSLGQLPPPGSNSNSSGSGSSISSNSSSNSGNNAAPGTTTTGAGRAQLGSKLSSIAEAPSSPTLVPLPSPPPHHQQQEQQQAKDLLGRTDSGPGRKAPREREASFTSLVVDSGAAGLSSLPGPGDGAGEGVTDDSYLFNLDQDAGNRGGSGRARLRRNSACSLAAVGGSHRGHGSLPADAAAGGIVLRAAGGGSMTDENPSTRPRR